MPSWLPFSFVALACPIGMGLMMWFVMRGMRGDHKETMTGRMEAMTPEEKLARLEAEKQALEQQIAAKNALSPEARLAQLEGEKKVLEQQMAVARNTGEVGKGAVLRPQDK
jgi:hypothetical protein